MWRKMGKSCGGETRVHRGLNCNDSHELKNVFKSVATTASAMDGPFAPSTNSSRRRNAAGHGAGDLACKMAAIALILWKKDMLLQPNI